jgi:hypothetical protein
MMREVFKMKRKLFAIALMICVFAGLALPAFAQTASITITEEDINSAYVVTNRPRRSVSDVFVDLQSGQVVVSATITLRNQSPIVATATLVPSISNGRLTWTVTEVTANGQAASQSFVTQVNASITSSWRNYVRRQMGRGRVASVTITESDITITFQ